jgi:catalase
VYAPNSYGGPEADSDRYADPSWFVDGGDIMRTAYMPHADDTDFVQPGTLYREVLLPTDQDHLVSNIVGHMSNGVERGVQERAVALWRQVDGQLGQRIAEGLGLQVQMDTRKPLFGDWPTPAARRQAE